MLNSGLRTKILLKKRTLLVLTTLMGLLYIFINKFYVTTNPRQVFKISTLNRSCIVQKEKVKPIEKETDKIPIELSSSNTKLNTVLNNIFNITKKIETIKEKFFSLDRTSNTTNEDNDIVSKYSNNRPTKSKYLLTLFSTWTVVKERYNISHNTLKNWASFKPTFNLVLFTMDKYLANDAQKYGWTVLPLSMVAENGLPILKYMYIDVITKFRSTYYCYANSDILFDDGLVKTLDNLENTLGLDFLNSRPVFLTGLRWNVVKVLPSELSSRENIKTLIKKRGKVFQTSAEDYFITNGIYPWRNIPEVVVGSRAYDNFLVANARRKKHLTIDASRTVPALHQSVNNNNYISYRRDIANYNEFLLEQFYKTKVPYHKGYIRCIEKFTDFVNNNFVLVDRKVKQNC